MHRSVEETSSDNNNRRNSLFIPRASMSSSSSASVKSSNHSVKVLSNAMHNENFILRRSYSVDILKAHSGDNESKLTNKKYEKSFDESINHDDNVPAKNSLDHHYEKHQAYFLHKTRKRDPSATQSSSSSSSNQSNYVRLIKYIESYAHDVQHIAQRWTNFYMSQNTSVPEN